MKVVPLPPQLSKERWTFVPPILARLPPVDAADAAHQLDAKMVGVSSSCLAPEQSIDWCDDFSAKLAVEVGLWLGGETAENLESSIVPDAISSEKHGITKMT